MQHLAHRHHLARRFRLHPRDLVHALIGEFGGVSRSLGFRRAPARAHDQEDDTREAAGEEESGHRRGETGHHQRIDLGQAGRQWVQVHPPLLARFAPPVRTKSEQRREQH